MASSKAMNPSAAVTAASSLIIEVDPQLANYIGPALARLVYLYPDAVFVADVNRVAVSGTITDFSAMRRELLHAVYRERIYAETLPLRRTLLDGLLAR